MTSPLIETLPKSKRKRKKSDARILAYYSFDLDSMFSKMLANYDNKVQKCIFSEKFVFCALANRYLTMFASYKVWSLAVAAAVAHDWLPYFKQ